MQDMEFTVENGKLYMLQTRNGKRTPAAAIKIACDLIDEGMKTEQEALLMLDPKQLDALLHPPVRSRSSEEGYSRGLRSGCFPRRCLRQDRLYRSRTPWSRAPLAKRWFWSVWRPLPRISRACSTLRAS